ncbi:MAG TPA: hypothetical protein VKA08_15105 [Balneolales bacterium]|nr:hypothetical protein [Balneolales bacterium]
MKHKNTVGIYCFREAGYNHGLPKKFHTETHVGDTSRMVLTVGGLGTISTSIHTYYHVVYIPTA